MNKWVRGGIVLAVVVGARVLYPTYTKGDMHAKVHDHFVGIRGNSAVRSSAFGVLALALRPGGYRWSFLTTPVGRIRDGGSATCH